MICLEDEANMIAVVFGFLLFLELMNRFSIKKVFPFRWFVKQANDVEEGGFA